MTNIGSSSGPSPVLEISGRDAETFTEGPGEMAKACVSGGKDRRNKA